jgi:ABC-type antimicrobial peptide transport system permease subunit
MMDLLRKQVWATDSGVALAYSYTLEDFIGERMYAGPKFGFVMMCVFGCVGLVLVTIGVYSVLAYATARKTHEIGIRMALGAKGADVLGLIVGMGLRLVGIGILIGSAFMRTIPRRLRPPPCC